ncbi:UNVERIFIED_CONTAM: FIP1V-like protein [Sesamum indicum]
MEDDDEFGDLYTDVLRPLTASVQSQPGKIDAPATSQSRPIDPSINSDDEEILYGASDLKNLVSNSGIGLKLNASIQEKTLPQTGERGGFDLNLYSNKEASRIAGADRLEIEPMGLGKGEGSGGVNFMEEDDDLNIVLEERENKDDELVEKDVNFVDKPDNVYSSAERNETTVNFTGPGAVGEMGSEQMIPGLSGKMENHGGSNLEDEWESDESEDDLQIVLNDNNHGPMGMERMPGGDDEDDEDGEPLVIVADNGDVGHHHHHQQMMMEEQEYAGEEGGPGADGERKELGDTAKASGVGGAAAPAAVQPKIGYSNHVYHHPFHSQFKYVRPGAAPIPGAAPVTPGGIQGQVRPPVTMGAVAGRGRGDWRPAGIKGAAPMQKGFPGYGMPAWGANAAGRGYGSGLDFTLPSHKTIFEVDIDGFEEKPWRLPGIDMSDFFNFGLNEDSWKDYCKRLEQLRLETSMQSKIRVYESGRAEQDYDPDLPPELAAAVGIQETPSENANPGKLDAGPTDLARASARGRPPVPIGRPIPVETGSGDRLPSIDTRRPRMHDSDAIIEIVCQSSPEDDEMAEQQINDPAAEDLGGVDEVDDIKQDDADRIGRFSHAYNGQNREVVAKRAQVKSSTSRAEIGREDDLHFASEAPVQYHPDREIGISHEESDRRSTKGRGHVKSPKMNASENNREKQIVDDQNESFDSEDGKQKSSSRAIESDGEQVVTAGDEANDESVLDDKNSDMEKEEMAVDAPTNDALGDGKLMHSTNKQKINSLVEPLSQEHDDGEDSKTARSSDNSKARSGSSKDHRKFQDSFEDEVLQDRHHARTGNIKRAVADEDTVRRKSRHERDEPGRHHIAVKGREDSHSRRSGDVTSSVHRHMKGENADWRKESDISEGSWRRRDEDLHGRRARVEDTRKREHGGEIGSRNRAKVRESERSARDEHHQSRKQVDNGSWRGANNNQDMGSRQRDRDDNLKTRNEKVDDPHNKRRKEGAHINWDHAEKEDITYNHRESSSSRKREKDDSSDQWKRDEHAKVKDDDMHYARQKEDGSLKKERGERQRDGDERHRLKESHEEILSRREREETRPVMRSGRPAEDKTWSSHSRGKDEYKGSGREYHPKDVGRHSDQLKRRDRVENESFLQNRGHEDMHARGNQVSNDKKRTRYEKSGTSDERVVYASDTSRLHEPRQKESSRKSKESESGDRGSLIPSKRNQDEHSGQISETVCISLDPMP